MLSGTISYPGKDNDLSSGSLAISIGVDLLLHRSCGSVVNVNMHVSAPELCIIYLKSTV